MASFQELMLTLQEQKGKLLLQAAQQQSDWEQILQQTFLQLENATNCQGFAPTMCEGLRPSLQPAAREEDPSEPEVFSRQVSPQTASSGIGSNEVTGESPDQPEAETEAVSPNSDSRMNTKRSYSSKRMATMGILLAANNPNRTKQRLAQLIRAYIDYVAGALVLVNSFVLMLQLELEGRNVAYELGIAEGANFSGVLPTFRVVDTVFVFVFLGEFLLRLAVEGTAFFKDLANYLDAVLVAGGLFDIILSVNAGEDGATLRFVTALKAFRAIRMVRSFRFFKGLRGLVKACQCCLPSLCWSMVLLAVFMCMGGLIMGNLLQDFIKDETQSLEDRQWVWQRYGTSYRATYTLYEITFAGNWPTNARPVLEKVNQGFVVFFLLYVTIIVFAVIRVISAIFLKDTLDEAHNDAQQLVMDRLKKKADYIQRLEGLFRTIDDSGAGMITEDRLTEILSNPKVKAYFQTLEIDVQEASTLFHLLDNGDGEVTLEEFIDGIMRCKGPARAIDTVALHADLRQVDAKLAKLTKQLKETNLVQSRASKAKTDSKDAKRKHVDLKIFNRVDPERSISLTSFEMPKP
ncbi:unnamed protein product [Effrenium voratum]|uniref:Ion transport domain-containing protein n=1 Tax=Effrenium voratum TaxID=2562239 RepID=A0AA36IQG4_9DINO|nr:unnamed protein product [Effrenium voratum]CAJ1416551.1 unnamed protein product [Effrenium voratum]